MNAAILMDNLRESFDGSSPVDVKKDLAHGESNENVEQRTDVLSVHSSNPDYRLYKRRFIGITGLES